MKAENRSVKESTAIITKEFVRLAKSGAQKIRFTWFDGENVIAVIDIPLPLNWILKSGKLDSGCGVKQKLELAFCSAFKVEAV